MHPRAAVWPGLGKPDFPLAPLGTTDQSTSAREERGDAVVILFKLGGYLRMVLTCTLRRSGAASVSVSIILSTWLELDERTSML